MGISQKKVQNTQDTVLRTQKVYKLKGPSEDTSVAHGRMKKATKIVEGGTWRVKRTGGERET